VSGQRVVALLSSIIIITILPLTVHRGGAGSGDGPAPRLIGDGLRHVHGADGGAGPVAEPQYPKAPPGPDPLSAVKLQPQLPPDPETSPDKLAELAIKFLLKGPAGTPFTIHDRYNIRFTSTHGIPAKLRSDFLRSWAFWSNNLHLVSAPIHARPVPDSRGLLWWFFLDEYNWNSTVWSRVADRSPFFVEGVDVSPANAQQLRGLLGIEQNPHTFALQAILRLDWLFIDSSDETRSATYTDLLYAPFQVGATHWESKMVTMQHAGGDFAYPDHTGRVAKAVAPGTYNVELKFKRTAKAAKKFPVSSKDIDKVFGSDLEEGFVRDSARKAGIDPAQGAVVAHGTSIVAVNNRLVASTPNFGQLLGRRHETFDTDTSSGQTDYTESRNKNVVFKFGELFWRLPGGGYAYALQNAQFQVQAKADADIVRNTAAIAHGFARVTVFNPGTCPDCHYTGVIVPENHLATLQKAGVRVNFLDRREALTDAGFFFSDLRESLEDEQRSYARFIAKTSGFDPAKNTAVAMKFRQWYTNNVTVEQAAREAGVTVDYFKQIVIDGIRRSDIPGITNRTPLAQLHSLAVGLSVSRDSWDASGYRTFNLLQRSVKK
jgi:hypothetical protein